jgi:hypothetical protein
VHRRRQQAHRLIHSADDQHQYPGRDGQRYPDQQSGNEVALHSTCRCARTGVLFALAGRQCPDSPKFLTSPKPVEFAALDELAVPWLAGLSLLSEPLVAVAGALLLPPLKSVSVPAASFQLKAGSRDLFSIRCLAAFEGRCSRPRH